MEPAERLDRLKAALVDGVLFAALFLLARMPVIGGLVWLALLAVTGVQWYLLSTRGQSIGKTLVSIRIVKNDTGENGGFVTNVLLRSIVNGLLTCIPFYFLVDSLFIFRADRRCVHDFLAGTRVVKA